MTSSRRGLTLIDLLTFITTLGILAAVVVFSLGGAGTTGKVPVMQSNTPAGILDRAHLVTDAAALIAQDQPSPSIAPVLLSDETQLQATTPVWSIALAAEKGDTDYFTLNVAAIEQSVVYVCVAASKSSSSYTIALHACKS